MSYDLRDTVFLSLSFQQPSLYGDLQASLSLSGEVVQELGDCDSGRGSLIRSVMEAVSKIVLTGYAELLPGWRCVWPEILCSLQGHVLLFKYRG